MPKMWLHDQNDDLRGHKKHYKMAVSGITGKRTIEKEYRLARNVVKSAQTTISGTTDSSTTEESL